VHNYTIVVVGPRGHSLPHARPIAIKSASYDAATNTVTLIPKHRLKFAGYYRLTVNGSTPAGVTGLAGTRISGPGVAQSSSNYVAIVHKSGTLPAATPASDKPETKPKLRVTFHSHATRSVAHAR
jgi:hypothetical protein